MNQNNKVKSNRKIKGDFGEDYACNYLIKQGFVILCRNYRKPCGEIDIIGKKGSLYIFLEVKTRKYNCMVSGVEAVNKAKQRRIVKTADLYLLEHDEELPDDIEIRYDIAEITITNNDFPTVIDIEYYENAFDATGIYTVF